MNGPEGVLENVERSTWSCLHTSVLGFEPRPKAPQSISPHLPVLEEGSHMLETAPLYPLHHKHLAF